MSHDNHMIDDSEYLKRILTSRVYDVACQSPLEHAPLLSGRLENDIWLKREDLQSVFSFKLRGAYNRICTLTDAQRALGVICSSAGNHAQGVALAGRTLNIRALVVMPVTTPNIKVDAVRRLGAEVVLEGDAYDDAYAHARVLEAEQNLTFVHPFDDPDVIAGQGTIGMEILNQLGDVPDAVFVPIGGGGLMAGIATYIKALQPRVQLIGVEPSDSNSMQQALAAGAPVTLDHVGIFADGVAVKRVGDETFRLCQKHVDSIVTADTDEICAAIRDIFEQTRSVVEPAGALAMAGLKRYVADNGLRGKRLVAINCGANVNFDRLRHIAERASVGEHQEALFAVQIPEKRGSFMQFCGAIGKRNVTEFNYRYNDPQQANLFVGIELREGLAEKDEVLTHLHELGYTLVDLTENELAKVHVRHMVGGSVGNVEDEQLIRFEFPERPGTLMEFLQTVGGQWNISLFHYRNHGADHGRVLTGVQVPSQQRDEFFRHLDELGYAYWDETRNPAYQMFLG